MARVRVGHVSDQDAFLIHMVPGHGPFYVPDQVPAGTRQKRPRPLLIWRPAFTERTRKKIILLEITELFRS